MSKKRKRERVCVSVSVTCLGLEIPVFSPLFVRTSRRSSFSTIAESEIVLFFLDSLSYFKTKILHPNKTRCAMLG